MDALGILLPLQVHLIDVVGRVTGQEVVGGIGRIMEGAVEALLGGDSQRTTARGELEAGTGGYCGGREASRRGRRSALERAE